MKEAFEKYKSLLVDMINIDDFYTSSFCNADITFQGKYHSYKVKLYREKGFIFDLDTGGYVCGKMDEIKIILTE